MSFNSYPLARPPVRSCLCLLLRPFSRPPARELVRVFFRPPVCPLVNLLVCRSAHILAHSSVQLSVCSPVGPPARSFVRPPALSSAHTSVCAFFRLSARVRLLVLLFVRSSVRPFARPFAGPSSARPFVCLSSRALVRPLVCSSVRASVCVFYCPPVLSSVRLSPPPPVHPSVHQSISQRLVFSLQALLSMLSRSAMPILLRCSPYCGERLRGRCGI